MDFIVSSAKAIFGLFIAIVLSFLASCGIWDPADARKVSPNSKERVKKNSVFFSCSGLFQMEIQSNSNFIRLEDLEVIFLALLV